MTVQARITGLRAIPVALPLREPIVMARATITDSRHLLLRLDTDQGVSGLGECVEAMYVYGESLASAHAVLEGAFRPILVGASPFDRTAILAAMDRAVAGNTAVKAAVDMALHDLVGRLLGVPVAVLLGGLARKRARATWLVGTGGVATDAARAQAGIEQGFEVVKLKVGYRPLRADLEAVRAVREAIGPGADLQLDANQACSPDRALALARAGADWGATFFEQPLPYRNLEAMARLVARSPVPIAADEGVFTAVDVLRHAAAGAAEAVSIKLLKAGGLARAMEAIQVARGAGLGAYLAGKVAETSIATAAQVHLALALPELEYGCSGTSHYLAADVVRRPVVPEGGAYTLPDGPGLGVELDEPAVRNSRVDL